MSNKGRVIWNDNPFTVQFINQQIVLNGMGEFIVNQRGATLNEAQKSAQKKYFLSSGNMPDTLLFSRPQYNIWIELNYHYNQADILKYAHAIIDNGLMNKEKILIMDSANPKHLLLIKCWKGYSTEIDFINPNGLK